LVLTPQYVVVYFAPLFPNITQFIRRFRGFFPSYLILDFKPGEKQHMRDTSKPALYWKIAQIVFSRIVS